MRFGGKNLMKVIFLLKTTNIVNTTENYSINPRMKWPNKLRHQLQLTMIWQNTDQNKV